MKKIFKIVLVTSVVFVAILVLAIIAAALFFPTEKVKTLIEQHASTGMEMPVSIGDIGLSFAGIPALKVSNIVIGPPSGSDRPLATVKWVRVMVNIFKLIQKKIEIVSVEFNEPYIHMVISGQVSPAAEKAEDKTEQPVTPTLPFPVTLNTFRIKNGIVKIENPETNTDFLLDKISQKLSLEISSDLKTLNSTGTLSIEDISFSSPEIKDPVKGLSIELEHEITGDVTAGDFRVIEAKLSVNNLPVKISGELSNWTKASFDIETGSIRVEHLLEAIPSSLFPEKGKISSQGNFSLSINGFIDTEPEEPVVAYNGSVDIDNMSFSYNGFPKKVDTIETHIDFSEKEVDIKDLSIKTGNSKITLTGTIKSYMESPDMSLKIDGDIDMDDITGSLPVLEKNEIGGQMDMNLRITGAPSDPSAIDADGVLTFSEFVFRLPETLKNPAKLDGAVNISPLKLEMENFAMTSGKSDFSFSGVLNNYKNLVFPGENAAAFFKGRLTSDLIDLNDLLVAEEKQEPQSVKPWDLKETLETMPIPPNLSIETSIQSGKVIFGRLKADSAKGEIGLKNGVLELTDLAVNAYKGSLSGEIGADFSDIENVSYNGSFALEGFDSGVFISDFFGTGNFFRGKLSSSIKFAGAGLDSLEMLKNLTGEGIMRFEEGQIDNWDFTKKLGSHIKFLDFDTLDFDTIVNSFSIKDRKVITPDMKLKTVHGDILMNGAAGFDTSLDYDITLLLNKEASRKAAQFLSSVTDLVKVEAQSLEITVKAGGTIASPKFKLDTSKAQDQLKQEVKKELKSKAEEFIEEKIKDDKLKEEGKKLLKKLFK